MALLEAKGIEPDIIEYIVNPPSAEELKDLLAMLALEPRDILREKEAREEGIGNDLDGAELIQVIREHLRALQRPIVVKDGKAVIGRPLENILNIL